MVDDDESNCCYYYNGNKKKNSPQTEQIAHQTGHHYAEGTGDDYTSAYVLKPLLPVAGHIDVFNLGSICLLAER